jgi:uncharacterized integral membrane protein
MSFLRFVVLAAVFIVLLFISLQNAQPVTLQFFNVATWQAPLVFVILVAFATGVALGLLASAIQVVKLKRQLARIRREHQRASAAAVQRAPDTIVAPDAAYEPRSSRPAARE